MMYPTARTNGRNLFGELSREMDRLLGQTLPAGFAAMPVDIREEGDTLVIEAEIPGATQEQIDVTVENGTLSVAVRREAPAADQNTSYFVRERRSHSAARTFRLPDTADLERIEAQLTNGLLTLRVPKKEEAKPRQIQVK